MKVLLKMTLTSLLEAKFLGRRRKKNERLVLALYRKPEAWFELLDKHLYHINLLNSKQWREDLWVLIVVTIYPYFNTFRIG